METIIVQLPEPARPPEHGPGPAGRSGKPGLLHLGPGDVVDLGRGPAVGGGSSITLDDPGISRRAGQLEAAGDHWRLSNFSRSVSYVVENLEGAGEYITVAPGRLGAPVLFEFSRVVLPALTKTAASKVFAPSTPTSASGPRRASANRRSTPSRWIRRRSTTSSSSPSANRCCAIRPTRRCPVPGRSPRGCAPWSPAVI